MTQQPDDRQPEEPIGSPDDEPPVNEDAAWAAIVANYGERAAMGSSVEEPVEPGSPTVEPVQPARADRPKNIFDRTYIESNTERTSEATWDDEGHFVPPEPPPLPTLEPRRKLAWIGLFGAPALMLLGVVLGLDYYNWVSTLLVGSFVGGFVYLVATMPRDRRGDWSGDDGAVV